MSVFIAFLYLFRRIKLFLNKRKLIKGLDDLVETFKKIDKYDEFEDEDGDIGLDELIETNNQNVKQNDQQMENAKLLG